MYLLFLKIIEGQYEIVKSGFNIVPTEAYDKVLPTTEQIARQSDKVFFDGEKLKLKENETLLSIEELDSELNELTVEDSIEIEIYDIE